MPLGEASSNDLSPMSVANTRALRADPPRGWKLAVGLMLFGGIATIVYWVIWFFVDRQLLATLQTDAYFRFENAFPLADGWMAAASLLGAVALIRRRPSGILWTLLAASASIYLGSMDVLFDLENGVYSLPDKGNVAVELIINLLSFGIGAYGIFFAWRGRAYLASGAAEQSASPSL